MGKLTLLFVMAASLGGSMLLATRHTTAVDAARSTSGVQADVLARELATSAHRLVVGAAVGESGFHTTAPFSTMNFDGGVIRLDEYDATADSLAFTLTAFHSGAAHRIRSTYSWTESDFPGPLWLEVPYVSAALDPDAYVSGGPQHRPTYLDRSRFFDLRLESLLSFGRMTDSLSTQLVATDGPGAALNIPEDMDAVIRAAHAPTLEALYFDAQDAINAQDRVYTAPVTLTDELALGTAAAPRILYFQQGLTLAAGGRLSGSGLVLVEGALEIDPGGELDWDGLVLVHTEDDYIPVQLDGTVDLRGALLIDQVGAPPGGHMDLTVVRDHSAAWAEPKGVETQTSPVRPWHRHTHKYDQATGGRTAYFYENGAPGRYDQSGYHRTRFYSTLDFLGDEEMVLEFANPDMHGMSRYVLTLDDDGDDIVQVGTVKNGFGALADGSPFRTRPFPASALRTFTVEVRSLRLLSYKPNNENCGPQLTATECGDRPQGVGGHYDRDGALATRIRRASDNALLYEAALYWHWKESEAAEDAAEEEAWRAHIEAGEAFGTRLTMGDDVRLTFDLDAIRPIGERLGFLGTELVHQGTWNEHWSPHEAGMPLIDG